jgi:hypothetical protein
MDCGSDLPDGPAGDEQTGREGGFGGAESSESRVSHMLTGLSGAGDDGAREVGGEALLEPLLGKQMEIAAGHVDDAGYVFRRPQRTDAPTELRPCLR